MSPKVRYPLQREAMVFDRMQTEKRLFAGMRVAGSKTVDMVSVAVSTLFACVAFWMPTEAGSRDLALAVAISFALVAWLLRGVDASGAVAGMGVAFVFYRAGAWRLFAVLMVVFCITSAATWVSSAKLRKSSQRRTAQQVMANLLVPTVLLMAGLWSYRFNFFALPLSVAALAELAADTVSSEIGEAFGSPTYSLISFRTVNPGTNGGVTAVGTLAGVAAALTITAIATALNPFLFVFWLTAVAAIVGMLIDSLLGATLENRGFLNNETVNLLGTASAVGLAWLVMLTMPQIVY
jgi:uncharacterized protein (TIGR00297 family)